MKCPGFAGNPFIHTSLKSLKGLNLSSVWVLTSFLISSGICLCGACIRADLSGPDEVECGSSGRPAGQTAWCCWGRLRFTAPGGLRDRRLSRATCQNWSRPQSTDRSLCLPVNPTPTPSQIRICHIIVYILVPTKFGRNCGCFPGRDIGFFLKETCRSSLDETDSWKLF